MTCSTTSINGVKKRRALWQLLLLDGVLLTLVGVARPLSRWMLSTLPDCYVAQMGFVCPACGGTRAVSALCRGDWLAAVELNALVVLLVAYVVVAAVAFHIEVLLRQKWARAIRTHMLDYRAVIGWAIAAVLFCILRNIV